MQDNYKDIMGDKDFTDDCLLISRFRGMQCGVEFAEGFRMANDAYRTHPFRVLP